MIINFCLCVGSSQARHKEDKHELEIYDFLENYTAWDHNSTEMQNFRALFSTYQDALSHAVKCGYDREETLWNFLNAIFYTATIVTTIGNASSSREKPESGDVTG